ncbi:MAG: hypothetical protein ACYTGH_12155 [Planctomycetota bacterium]|jgi:hypothetical protein
MVRASNGSAVLSSEASHGEIRAAVLQRREELFRSGWKNKRQALPLMSRDEDNKFRFLVEWCEEFEEVRHKHRERLSDPNPRIRIRNGNASTESKPLPGARPYVDANGKLISGEGMKMADAE